MAGEADVIARGLAAQAQLSSGQRNAVTALLAGMPGGVERAVMATAPTIGTSTTAPVSPYTRLWPSAISASATPWAPVCAFYGGWPTFDGSARVRLRCATSAPATLTDPVAGNGADSIASRFGFWTDQAIFSIGINESAGLGFRVRINGQYASLSATASASTGADTFLTIDSTSAVGADGVPRYIELEFPSTGAMRRIYTKPTGSIWSPQPSGPRLMVIGDSFTLGPVSSQFTTPPPLNSDGFARCLGDILGVRDIWQSGEGGTGWVTVNGTRPTLANRAYDAVNQMPSGAFRSAWRPDLIVVPPFGLNDVSAGSATAPVQAAIVTFYNYCRAAIGPNVPIIIFGVNWRPIGSLAATQAMEAAIQAQVASLAASDPLLAFVPWTGSAYQVVFGTGYTGATNGSGNTDVMSGTDGVHPSYLGHDYIARQVAVGILASLKAMLGAFQ